MKKLWKTDIRVNWDSDRPLEWINHLNPEGSEQKLRTYPKHPERATKDEMQEKGIEVSKRDLTEEDNHEMAVMRTRRENESRLCLQG